MTPLEASVTVARDHLTFLHGSHGRVLEELIAVNDEIRDAEARLCALEAEQHCLGDGVDDSPAPMVVSHDSQSHESCTIISLLWLQEPPSVQF